MQAIAHAGGKNGCLPVQFPASITVINLLAFGEILQAIRANDPAKEWDFVNEFRHRSWYHYNMYQLLEQYNAGMVLHDMPTSATPIADIIGEVV